MSEKNTCFDCTYSFPAAEGDDDYIVCLNDPIFDSYADEIAEQDFSRCKKLVQENRLPYDRPACDKFEACKMFEIPDELLLETLTNIEGLEEDDSPAANRLKERLKNLEREVKSSKKAGKRQKSMDSDEWKDAEDAFAWVTTESMMSRIAGGMLGGGTPGGRIAPNERARLLSEILNDTCAYYFPARILRALDYAVADRHDGIDNIDPAEELDIAVNDVLELVTDKAKLDELIDWMYEMYERALQFPLMNPFLEKILEKRPDNLPCLESLGASYTFCIEPDKARPFFERYVKLNPDTCAGWSNIGWCELQAGNLEAAEKALKKARRIDSKDETASNNYKVLEYLKRRKGGTFQDFLLRPFRHIDEFGEDGGCEAVDFANGSQIQAFVQQLLNDKSISPKRLRDYKIQLNYFIGTVDKILDLSLCLEDIEDIAESIDEYVRAVIFRTSDVDKEMLEETFEALAAFWRFLVDKKLADRKEVDNLIAAIGESKPRWFDIMEKYNWARQQGENQKDRAREKYFDDLSPF